jgi:hypothetical protein
MQEGDALMIGLARLYCYQQGRFILVEVPRKEARDKQRQMAREGWVVTHTDLV